MSKATKEPTMRIVIGVDENPDLSWLDQWDTPEKYYGGAPKCSHGEPMAYTEDHWWKGNHELDEHDVNALRLRRAGWPDSDIAQVRSLARESVHWGEQDRALAARYEATPAPRPDELACQERLEYDGAASSTSGVVSRKDRSGVDERISFDRYIQHEGNPDKHVTLFLRVEVQCSCCGSWTTGDALYGIDFFTWNPWVTGTFAVEDVLAWEACAHDDARHYLAEIARDCIAATRRQQQPKS